MEQRSPRKAIPAHVEMAALQAIQGESFIHHIRGGTHQDNLTAEAISPEDLADCQGLLPTGTQDSLWDTGKGI